MADDDAKTNGYDREQAAKLVDELMDRHAVLKANNQKNSEKNAGVRGDIGAIYKRAKKLGFNTGALKETIRSKLEDMRREERRAEMDDEDSDALSLLLDALGEFADTPLGAAAKAAAGNGADRPRHLRQRDKDRAEEKAALASV